MDASEARTHHIRRLVAQMGGPAEFSRQTRWSQAQVSQWISESNPKGVGRQLAREIERALQLPEASLDRPPESVPGSHFGRLDPHIVATVFDALLMFLKRRDPNADIDLRKEEDAELFCEIYAEFAPDAANPQAKMILGATVTDLLGKREAVRHAGGRRGKQALGADGTEAREEVSVAEAGAEAGESARAAGTGAGRRN